MVARWISIQRNKIVGGEKINQDQQLKWIKTIFKKKELKINILLKPIIINGLNSPFKERTLRLKVKLNFHAFAIHKRHF